jgi:beta-lactamase superfamily II metal-dependent hydrolase
MKRLLLAVASAVLLAGCAAAPAEPAGVLFIDVGKGDAALVMAEGRRYLVDAGPKDAWPRVEAALRYYGVTALDGVFLTHGDRDHAGGLKDLAMSGMDVAAWYASDLYLDDGEKGHPAAEAAALQGRQAVFLSAGDAVGPFTVLAPLTRDRKDDDNNSLVLRFSAAGGSALLTGDMKFDEEEDLLKSGQSLRCELIKIAHHGNSDATSPALIEAVSPVVAVVSTDSDARPELPDPRIVALLEARGVPLVSTWRSGGGVLVTLAGKDTHAETVNIPAGPFPSSEH